MKKYVITALLIFSLLTLSACNGNNSAEEIADQQTTISTEEPPTEEVPALSEHSIIVNGVGLAPMYNFFILDGETVPSHVPLFPAITALGLSDISAGSQIAVQNNDGEFVAALNIVNYLAFDDGEIIDMSNVGLDDVFMAQNFGIYAPLSLFRELGFSAYFLDGHVYIY